MFGLFTEKDVRKLIARLREESAKELAECRAALAEIKEENRRLRARLSVLEGERDNVSAALIRAVEEGERIERESRSEGESKMREALLLAEKCRLLSDKLSAKYPDEEDCAQFAQFTSALRALLGGEEDEPAFNMDDVLAPKEPLDLEKLCKELGLMED